MLSLDSSQGDNKEKSMASTKTHPARQVADQTLVITRLFDAPRELVFKAWTQPQRAMQWWSPKDFTSPFCTIDLRVGGACRHCMRSPDGKDYWSKGVYREIVEPHRIVCTDSFCDDKGNFVSPREYGFSDWPDETLITATFDEQAGKTNLTLQHSPVPKSKETEMCRQGWNECLDKLADYLAKTIVEK